MMEKTRPQTLKDPEFTNWIIDTYTCPDCGSLKKVRTNRGHIEDTRQLFTLVEEHSCAS